MDNNIKIIDVYGSLDNRGEMHHYTYLTTNYSMQSGWCESVSDLRREMPDAVHSCYCCWCTKEGWWIGKIIISPHDDRNDPVMLSICLGNNRPKAGDKAVSILDSFVDFFIVEKNWNDNETEKKLLCDDQQFELLPCLVKEFVLPAMTPNSAYRTYSSKEELFKFLSRLDIFFFS